MSKKKIILPLTDTIIAELKAGDSLLLSGKLYTARDAAHKRLNELLVNNEELPIDIKNQTIYYVGPIPAKEGQVIGSAGPTTSDRMDKFVPQLLENGLSGMIGKGPRSQEVKDSIKKNKAIYFAAIGGAGALLSKKITAAKIVAYDDLGTEAIRELTIDNFPVIVVTDSYGNDLYEQRKSK